MIRYLFCPLHTRRLAEQAVQTALRAAEGAAESLALVARALELINRQQAELDRLRAELAAYRLGTIDEDAQRRELERMHAVKSG
jgi:hypothetical protein